jgi:hypothetical protein
MRCFPAPQPLHRDGLLHVSPHQPEVMRIASPLAGVHLDGGQDDHGFSRPSVNTSVQPIYSLIINP